jgi:uncharacterized protein
MLLWVRRGRPEGAAREPGGEWVMRDPTLKPAGTVGREQRDACEMLRYRCERYSTDFGGSWCESEGMSDLLRHDLELLHQSLLSGKLPRNLSWADVVELVKHLGTVEPHGSDDFAFSVGGQRAFFKKPHGHDLGVEEVSRLRGFLRAAGPASSGAATPAQPDRMVVVIDHHSARLFHEAGGSEPTEDATIKPYDPFHFHHHLIHKKEAHYKGERIPEENAFYEEIAQALVPAVEIVLIGHGKGTSSAVEVLGAYLKTHHPEISRRVMATESADLSALTEAEIEQMAAEHMIAVV